MQVNTAPDYPQGADPQRTHMPKDTANSLRHFLPIERASRSLALPSP